MNFEPRQKSVKKSFVKLTSGQSVEGFFRDKSVKFYQHWTNGAPSLCPGKAQCDLCKAGEKASFRFRVNFILKEDGKWVSRVFEQGGKVYDQLAALSSAYPNLGKAKLRIMRQGSGPSDTTYMILPVGEITPVEEAEVSKVALQPLVDEPPKKDTGPDFDSSTPEEAPF